MDWRDFTSGPLGQLRLLTEFQKELAVNYCKLAVVSTDPPEVTAQMVANFAAGGAASARGGRFSKAPC